ncbi:hypothetical protein TNCV_1630651 [Trichonephila clavipes]|uniref:Uncharacterized protein n=1 Tax=Trichonephila clavipes TaxID=2585209 RepID=A0A8X6VWC5_TRICX|nr:hypothetical protein TNCV_1630651 [Trichonephila clavipes]
MWKRNALTIGTIFIVNFKMACMSWKKKKFDKESLGYQGLSAPQQTSNWEDAELKHDCQSEFKRLERR